MWAHHQASGHAVGLSVKTDNKRARALYERHGFFDAGPSPTSGACAATRPEQHVPVGDRSSCTAPGVVAARYARHRTSAASEPARSPTAAAHRRSQDRAAPRRSDRAAPGLGRAPRSRPATPCIGRSSRPARQAGRVEWCCSLGLDPCDGKSPTSCRRAALAVDVQAGQQAVEHDDIDGDEPSSPSMTRDVLFVIIQCVVQQLADAISVRGSAIALTPSRPRSRVRGGDHLVHPRPRGPCPWGGHPCLQLIRHASVGIVHLHAGGQAADQRHGVTPAHGPRRLRTRRLRTRR
jgi:hypothetical protein